MPLLQSSLEDPTSFLLSSFAFERRPLHSHTIGPVCCTMDWIETYLECNSPFVFTCKHLCSEVYDLLVNIERFIRKTAR